MTEITSLISYTLEADIKGRRPAVIPTFVQYDSASIDLYIRDGGVPYDLSIFDKVDVFHRLPGGEVFVGGGTIILGDTVEDSLVRYVYSGSEMMKAGTVNTSISLYSKDKKVSIQNFQVNIVADNGEGIEVTEEYGAMQELLVQVEDATAKALDASESIGEVLDETRQILDEIVFEKDELTEAINSVNGVKASTEEVRDSTEEVRLETLEIRVGLEDVKAETLASAEYAKEQGKRAEDAVDAMDKVLEEGTVQTVNGQTGNVVLEFVSPEELESAIDNIPLPPEQDLSPYAKTEDVQKDLDNKADKSDVDERLNGKADKSELEELSDVVAEKYMKPESGVPKSDLNSNVQESLDKADSALQTVSKEDVGLSNVSNEKQATKVEHDAHAGKKASSTELGHVMVGAGLDVAEDGTLSVVQEEDADDGVPSGIISMWSGAIDAIPTGWALCNGNNGTPNLLNRFIVGAGDKYAVGNTGGADSVALTTGQMPSHTHAKGTLATASTSVSGHSIPNTRDRMSDVNSIARGGDRILYRDLNYSSGVLQTGSGNDHTHNITGSTASAGSGQAHENRPPYYALAFIMKL